MTIFRSVLLAAAFTAAATGNWPGSSVKAQERKGPALEGAWQLAQAGRRGDAAEEDERKRRPGKEQRQEDRRDGPNHPEAQRNVKPPVKVMPAQGGQGAHGKGDDSRRKEPPRIEARPPTPPNAVRQDSQRRQEETSKKPPGFDPARPPVMPKVTGDQLRRKQEDDKGGKDRPAVKPLVPPKVIVEDPRRKQEPPPHKQPPRKEEVRPSVPPKTIVQDPHKGGDHGRKEARDERRDGRGSPFRRLDDLKGLRKERVEQGGRKVIEEPDRRIIVKEQGRTIIRHDESERFRRKFRDVREERRNGLRIATFVGPDGVHIISEYDEHDRLVRRYRRYRDGRIVVLIDNRRPRHHHHSGPGFMTGLIIGTLLNLPPPKIHIPREKYIVEYDRASYEDVYEALTAPPVEELEDRYTLDEILYNHSLRERMRRIDLDTITFDFGSWEVAPEQYPKLERIARAINRILERNPDEIFLIEGHTDAVGSEEDNLTLSDRRAETVAMILSEEFGVPPENLVTQGYGEQFLKIPTDGPERANRRVAVRRITPLLSRADY